MNVKKYLDFRLFGLTGSIMMIVSEFIPWIGQYSLFLLYLFLISVEIETAFLYLFPLISGIICLLGSILIIHNIELRINSAIVMFIGLGFLFLFFFDFIPNELVYLGNANIGFYLCIVGFLLTIIALINILMLKD